MKLQKKGREKSINQFIKKKNNKLINLKEREILGMGWMSIISDSTPHTRNLDDTWKKGKEERRKQKRKI